MLNRRVLNLAWLAMASTGCAALISGQTGNGLIHRIDGVLTPSIKK